MLDDVDHKLLNILVQDSSRSMAQIARALGIPRATVQYRVQKLRERGYIKGFHAVPDHSRLGRTVTAFVLISFQPNPDVSQRELADKIGRIPGVYEVHLISGQWDLLLKVRGATMEDIGRLVIDKLRGMKGVAGTVTCASFTTVKEEF